MNAISFISSASPQISLMPLEVPLIMQWRHVSSSNANILIFIDLKNLPKYAISRLYPVLCSILPIERQAPLIQSISDNYTLPWLPIMSDSFFIFNNKWYKLKWLLLSIPTKTWVVAQTGQLREDNFPRKAARVSISVVALYDGVAAITELLGTSIALEHPLSWSLDLSRL